MDESLSDMITGDEPAARRRVMLRSAMGPAIAAALADPAVVEIMVNPDGRLRLDRLGEGRVTTNTVLDRGEVERIIRLVAAHLRAEIHAGAPILSAELPAWEKGRAGERFEGIIPPIAEGPCFAIRKPANRLYALADYVADGIMSQAAADILCVAVRARANILIAGGTSSGKTTLVNALLREMGEAQERLVLIEDTRELHSTAADTVALRTRSGTASMTDLVRSTLRLRPDRIIVGEVRGPEALDMLKAWNTGHPGGIATVHANSALAALHRIESLIQEAVAVVPRQLIAEGINLVAFLEGRGQARRLASILRIHGLGTDGSYAWTSCLPDQPSKGTRP